MPLSLLAPPEGAPVALAPPELRRATLAQPVVHTPRRDPGRDRRRLFGRLTLGLALLSVVLVTAGVTGWNVSGAPHYESDEGTYVGSAWSMFEEGKLSYYTYNYDHPPLGWAMIGIWARLVGGFMALGSSIATARVLMVVVAVIAALLLLAIVRRATGSLAAGVCTAMLFAVSPLGTSLHRQVWLDNFVSVWLLLSLFFVLEARRSLKYVLLSAVAFGLAFWTKEVAAVFLPGMLLVVGVLAHRSHRRFAVALWAATAIGMISFFVLLAFLKDELLPPGVLWSSAFPHVSLVDTYSWQMSRDGGGSILSVTSDFRQLFAEWWRADPVLVLGGAADAVLALLLVRRIPFASACAVLALTYLAFLARGGVVLYYYVIPVLALLALTLGLMQGYAARILAAKWRPVGHAAGAAFLAFAVVRASVGADLQSANYTQHPAAAQDAAATWMIDALPRDSIILMDSYAWVELRDPATTNEQPFQNAHYYWPGVSDPSIRSGVLHDNWRDIDYLAVSPSVEADIANRDLPILPDALANSDEVRTFYSDQWSVRILRVRKLHEQAASADPFLTPTWQTFRDRFVHDGQVVDPVSDVTTSETQANALLQAVYADDRPTFDAIFGWTQAHLQVRSDDALLASQWGADGSVQGTPLIGDNEDAALALLFAARRWGDPTYQAQAQRIIGDIWSQGTAVIGPDQQRVLLGTPVSDAGLPMVNPAAFAPYAYRIFGDVDPEHPWHDVVDSSYDVLGRIRANDALGGAAGVVPEWVGIDPTTGQLQPAAADASQFGYDASRVAWRLALDWLWFQDDRARSALDGITLPERELTATNRLAAAYSLDGQPAAAYEATSMYANAIPGLLVRQKADLAQRVFAQHVFSQYTTDGTVAYWGDPSDLHDQTWSWFATALMDGGLANLWSGTTQLTWDEVLP